MSTKLFTPLLGKRLRLTQLDACGRVPVAGASQAFITTSGFISVELSAEVEDGVEIIQKRADGALCVNEKFANSFKRFNVNLTFCGVIPTALSITTNAEGYEDYAGDVAGITVPEGPIDKEFALELWTGLSGRACEDEDEEASGYLVLPRIQAGTMADLTADGENAITFGMSGGFTKGGNTWGSGTWEVVMDDGTPAVLPTPLDALDHLLLMDTGLAPPPASEDWQAMPESGQAMGASTQVWASED